MCTLKSISEIVTILSIMAYTNLQSFLENVNVTDSLAMPLEILCIVSSMSVPMSVQHSFFLKRKMYKSVIFQKVSVLVLHCWTLSTKTGFLI